ncbi:MAG: uracil-DNA glycosylase [Acidimicrobiia bacterium]|nr:uracil-DNA glycosylase [Acidimicrobiia bacterium]
MLNSLPEVAAELIGCRACPRLVEWREAVAVAKRASFSDQEYWGRPVPGFGDPDPKLFVVGLAPAAHGANRTGRMFTGDRSGDWLFGALHRAGVASQTESRHADDGLTLRDVYVTSAVHCAPPDNKPTTTERDTCGTWLLRELAAAPNHRAILCLGQFGFQALWKALGSAGTVLPRPRPRFGHGAVIDLEDGRRIVLSYHPSQQNTFTGRLTEDMLDAAVGAAISAAGITPTSGGVR